MKVIHLISGGDTGGAKTHVHLLLKNLSQTVDLTMVCFMRGPFSEEAAALGIRTVVMEGNNIFRTLSRLREMIRAEGFEIIHCHGSRGNLMGALLKRSLGIPVISTVHSDYQLDYMGRPLAAMTYGKLNAISLRCMDYRVGVSDYMKKLLVSRGFAPNDIFVIYNGIEFERNAQTYDRRSFYARMGFDIPENAVVAGIAARLDPVKDMVTLIRGFALAHAQQPQLRLIIAGEGAERERLGALAKELGVEREVFFAGWLTNMDEFYQSLDINTLTSISETFPYAVTEGAFWHLPIVSSRVGGVPALVKDGETGYLFEPGDYKRLGERLAAYAADEALRRRMGDALHKKSAEEFSMEATCRRQKEVYDAVLRRQSAKKTGAREGVVICGAYGHGNAGDEAILEAILNEMRAIDPTMPLTVLSRSPKETRQRHLVNAVNRFDFPKYAREMRRAKLYLNGGGSLIQNVTSRRSLWFYLQTLRLAKNRGCKVIMYGCGIGPVKGNADRRSVAKYLNRYVDTITLREEDSLHELRVLGVTEARILLSSDPALTLPAADDALVDTYLSQNGIDPAGKYICFALRPWTGFAQKTADFRRAAEYAWEKYGLTPVFLSVNHRSDGAAADMVAEGMRCPYHILREPMSTEVAIGVLGRMTALISMRLHGLIFAAGRGVPLIGVSYDPKVTAFLDYIGQGRCTALDVLEGKKLCAMIDEAAAEAGHTEARDQRVRRLIALESLNAKAAAELLK